jgi:hypothetical protein
MQTPRRGRFFDTARQKPVFSRSERRLLAGLGVLVASSWGRFLATGSLKVDESYPTREAGYALLAALVAGWALAVTGWRGLLDDPPRAPRRTAYAALGITALMLPMLSNDVFSVLSYGAAAANGHDVYTTTQWLPQAPLYPWLGERWRQTVCVYGPLTLLASMPARLAGASPWAGVAVLRLFWLVPTLCVLELSLRRLREVSSFHAMVWLNPLWLVQGPGQLHADLLGLALVTAGIVALRGGKDLAALGLYALALLGKYSFAPAGLWFWLSGPASTRARLARLGTMGAITVALALLLYAPFWKGPETIAAPTRALARMNPGGSITEVMGIVVQFLRTGTVTPPDMAVQGAVEVDRASKHLSWWLVSWLTRLVFVVIAARVIPVMLRRGAGEDTIALGTGVVTVALVTIASHRFQCWYLLAALPFFGLACTPPWRRWWVAVVAVSVPVDFACVLERSSVVYPVWGAVSTGALVVVFLAWFKSRYLDFPGDARQARAESGAPPAATAPEAR